MQLPNFIANEPVRVKALVAAGITVVMAFIPNLHFTAEQQLALGMLATALLTGGEVVRQNTVPTNKLTAEEQVKAKETTRAENVGGAPVAESESAS